MPEIPTDSTPTAVTVPENVSHFPTTSEIPHSVVGKHDEKSDPTAVTVSDRMPGESTFGERLTLARKRKGYRQQDMSQSSGISVTFLSEIENGHREPGMATLIALVNALGVSLDWLVLGKAPHPDPAEESLAFNTDPRYSKNPGESLIASLPQTLGEERRIDKNSDSDRLAAWAQLVEDDTGEAMRVTDSLGVVGGMKYWRAYLDQLIAGTVGIPAPESTDFPPELSGKFPDTATAQDIGFMDGTQEGLESDVAFFEAENARLLTALEEAEADAELARIAMHSMRKTDAEREAKLEALQSSSVLQKEELKYFPTPFQFKEPATDSDTAMIVDAKGFAVAYLFWPTHPADETEAAERETYRLGRAMAAVGSPTSGA